jgi:DNA-directed RNA polymerase specialized sigma24 family protein
MSQDDLAAFEALGGRLTWDELARRLGYADGQALSRALPALPRRSGEAVELCRLTGLSEREAAAAMHVSAGAVRSHLARGLLMLRHPPGT